MELDDFHILLFFNARLNERVWNVDNRDIPILLGIDDDCQNDGLCGYSWQASILLGNVCALFNSSGHCSYLYLPVSLLLEKHVGLQHNLVLFVGQFTLVHANERIIEV